jgi:hypothetical protein
MLVRRDYVFLISTTRHIFPQVANAGHIPEMENGKKCGRI